MDSSGDGAEQDLALLICDPIDVRLEILETGNLQEDQALGRRIAALINTYFVQDKSSLAPCLVSGQKAVTGLGRTTREPPSRVSVGFPTFHTLGTN